MTTMTDAEFLKSDFDELRKTMTLEEINARIDEALEVLERDCEDELKTLYELIARARLPKLLANVRCLQCGAVNRPMSKSCCRCGLTMD